MENYILQILENNNRVIVPEFGAFIVKQRNPLTIIFNEFLQYNDGMLVDFISKKENISRDDAKVKIDDFIKGVNKAIESESGFALGKLGVIRKNAAGKISIDTDGETEKPTAKTVKPTTPKTAATKSSKPQEKKVSQEKKPEDEIKEEPKVTEPVKKESADLKKENAPSEVKKEDKQAVSEVKEKAEEKKMTPPVSKEKKEDIKVAPKKEEPRKAETARTYSADNYDYSIQPAPKKKRTNLLVWIIVIVIVNGLLISYFIFNGDLKNLFKSDKDTEVTNYLEDEVLLDVS